MHPKCFHIFNVTQHINPPLSGHIVDSLTPPPLLKSMQTYCYLYSICVRVGWTNPNSINSKSEMNPIYFNRKRNQNLKWKKKNNVYFRAFMKTISHKYIFNINPVFNLGENTFICTNLYLNCISKTILCHFFCKNGLSNFIHKSRNLPEIWNN